MIALSEAGEEETVRSERKRFTTEGWSTLEMSWSLFSYVSVSMCACTCACVCACMYEYVCMRARVFVHACMCICACTRMCSHLYRMLSLLLRMQYVQTCNMLTWCTWARNWVKYTTYWPGVRTLLTRTLTVISTQFCMYARTCIWNEMMNILQCLLINILHTYY